MFIDAEKIANLVKDALKDLGMKENGRIYFHASGIDFLGEMNSSGQVIHEDRPRWNLQLLYPISESEPSKTFDLEVNTIDFQTEDEIKNFIASEIRKQAND
jgi:hypothetical protein